MIADFWRDLRFAVRSLKLRPGYSLLVVITLALGIGANLAIFDLTNAAILRPLDVHEPEELILLGPGGTRGRKAGGDSTVLTRDGRVVQFPHLLFRNLEAELEGVSIAARDPGYVPSIVWLESAAASDSYIANGRSASASFFDVLGLRPHLGRTFEAEDDRVQGARPVVVLSHRFWQLRFDSDPGAVGERLIINGTSYQIVGVGPAGFRGATAGNPIDFWVPLGMANTFPGYGPDLDDHTFSWLQIIARLKPGTTPEAVESSANLIFEHYITADPQRAADFAPKQRPRIEVESGAAGFSRTRDTLATPLLLLLGGVGMLLFIVYLNVSQLMLARAASRLHEMSIRTALGASRGRVVRQLTTEGLLLASLGAATGALVAGWMSRGLAALASGGPGRYNFQLELGADGRVVAFTLVLTLGTALVLGLVPAAHALASTSTSSMRTAARTVTVSGSRGRRALMAAQVGVSFVLLIAAGLLSTSLSRLLDSPSGLDEEHVLIGQIEMQKLGLEESRMQSLYQEIPQRLMTQPGIVAASLSSSGRGWAVKVPGTELPPTGAAFIRVTTDYAESRGRKLVRGRDFRQSDSADSQRVALINETMARTLFENRDAVGQVIRLDDQHDVEVIGVLKNARFDQRQPFFPFFMTPITQPTGLPMPMHARGVQVRVQGDPAKYSEVVRRTLAEAQPGLTVTNLQTLSHAIDAQFVPERLLAVLASVFGLSALLLVAVGLYGVISQWVTRRAREVGVRMALGATPGRVQRLVLGQVMIPVLSGLVMGAAATVPATRLLEGLLYGVQPLESWVLFAAVVILLAVALLAAYLPALRASRVPPVVAMRCE